MSGLLESHKMIEVMQILAVIFIILIPCLIIYALYKLGILFEDTLGKFLCILYLVCCKKDLQEDWIKKMLKTLLFLAAIIDNMDSFKLPVIQTDISSVIDSKHTGIIENSFNRSNYLSILDLLNAGVLVILIIVIVVLHRRYRGLFFEIATNQTNLRCLLENHVRQQRKNGGK